MKHLKLFGLLLVVMTAASILFAQHQSPSQAKSSDVSLQGTVKEVTHPEPQETHVLLQTNGGTQEIYLGDSRFLDENGLSPKAGSTIEVTGFADRTEDGSLFIANTLKQEGRKLKLWNAMGPARSANRRGWYCNRNHADDYYDDYDRHGSGHYGPGDHHRSDYRHCCWW
jgi:hypothetical protein